MEDNQIYVLTMEDFQNTLEENYTEEKIAYIKNNFTEQEIQSILRDKIQIDYMEYIKAVIDYRLLDK